MYCLKCGKETLEDQAFCLECQKEMAKYPVDPGIAVQLPTRKPIPSKKPAKRRITPEEQIRALRKRLRISFCLLLAALAMIAGLAISLFLLLNQERAQIGKNYTTVRPGTTVTAPVTEPK